MNEQAKTAWRFFECEEGRRWTASIGGICDDTKDGDSCTFSGCPDGHKVRIVKESADRDEAHAWFRAWGDDEKPKGIITDPKAKNRAEAEAKRSEYMTGAVSHADYYLWLADFIGVGASMLPVSMEMIKASTDEHLNDIPLNQWDSMHSQVRSLAFAKGLPWSLSDTVCVLKAIARKEA